MQATIGCLSRIVSRTLISNVVTNQQQQQHQHQQFVSTAVAGRQVGTSSTPSSGSVDGASAEVICSPDHARLVTAVSGFPKTSSAYNIDHILKGQVGDDAYFITRHLDDWSSSSSSISTSNTSPIQKSAAPRRRSTPRQIPTTRSRSNYYARSSSHSSEESSSPSQHPTVEQLLNPLSGLSVGSSSPSSASESSGSRPGRNDDSSRSRHASNAADVIGVADGVGGWRQYGVDPGQFSMQLMRSCERLVNSGYFVSNQPARLLAQGFSEMQASKKSVIGSSTACLAMLSHADGKLYTANIGDSGLLVVRDGRVVHRSAEQQHYFNTPYQLSLPPTEMASDVLADRPEAADRYEFNVEDGDVIILATDGIFDNVPDDLLVEQVESLRGCTDDVSKIQACANSIALIARTLSRDEHFLSPFAKNARASGFDVTGGKEDDVTVVLAAVNCPPFAP